jgi:uncharacterized Tic20 family protein
MTSYGSQPTPRWPASGPASSSAQPPLPDSNGGKPEVPAPRPEWQTGPHAVWRTAEGAPWPDGPAEGPAGQAAGPQPSDGAESPGGSGQYAGPQQYGEAEQYVETGSYGEAEQYGDAGPSAGPAQASAGQGWPSRKEPGRRPWPLQPLSSEPASGQWLAQLRRQAPAAGEELAAQPAGTGERWAMISYLGVPFLAFVPPLLVYLIKFRSSPFARLHATQALNLSLTVLLYSLCAVIVGGLLALDSVAAALVLMVPVLAALWLVTLAYLILAATAASRGEGYRLPHWLCATLVH